MVLVDRAKVLVPIIFPLAAQESSGCSTSFSISGTISLFHHTLVGTKQCCTLLCICIFMILALWTSSWKGTVQVFRPFSIGLPVFFSLVCRKLFILLDICIVNIFSLQQLLGSVSLVISPRLAHVKALGLCVVLCTGIFYSLLVMAGLAASSCQYSPTKALLEYWL